MRAFQARTRSNKVGSGNLVLATANTYTGGTNLAAGTIQINNSASLGTGALAMNGANTVLLAGNNGLNVANAISAEQHRQRRRYRR